MFSSPDRNLLNVHFEGYKLSSDPLTYIRASHSEPVKVARLTDDEFSYQYVRAYTLHNHLHHAPSDPSSVYWCNNKNSVIKGTVTKDSISTQDVYSFSDSGVECRANFSMFFLTDELGVACAGDNRIVLFKKRVPVAGEGENTTTSEQWTAQASAVVGESGYPVVIVTGTMGAAESVEILCAELLFDGEGKVASEEQEKALVNYKWIRIDLGDITPLHGEAEKKLETKTMCEINSTSHALYAAFQQEETSKTTQLLFLSETEPVTTPTSKPQTKSSSNTTSIKPESNIATGATEECDAKNGEEEGEEDEPDRYYGLGYKQDENEGKVYTWEQSEEDVVIAFQLAEDVMKKDLCVRIEPPEIVVGLSDGSNLLRGELGHAVDTDGCTWTLEKNM